MKKIFCIFLVRASLSNLPRLTLTSFLFCLISTSILAQSSGVETITWSTVASQPYNVNEAQGETVNGKLYTFGGFDSQKSTFTPTKRAYVYDPATNIWTPIADLPFTPNGTNFGGVTHSGITTDGTNIFLAGGYTSNADGTGQIFGTNQVWRYNVSQNTYTQLTSLPYATSAGQLEYYNGKLHLIGGTNPSRTTDLGDHLVLDLSNLSAGWTNLAPLPNPRHHGGSAVLGGKIYFIGGQHEHDGSLVTQNDVHAYNPSSNTWTAVSDLPTPPNTNGRAHITSSVVVLNDQIIVLGGETSHGVRTDMVSVYSPSTNSWINTTPLPQTRYSGVAGAINGNVYYTGGSSTKITYKGEPLLGNSSSILPIADAYVRNGTYAAINFGTETSLFVKTYTTKANYSRNTFLKFPLNSVSDVGSAKLRVYGRNTETTTTINLSVFGVDDDSWTETNITWNNAPTSQTTALGSLAVNNVAKYFDIDVTNFIKAQMGGDKIASFVIKDPANQNQIAGFNSRENAQYPPQLIIGNTTIENALAFAPTSLNYNVVQNGYTSNQTTTLSASQGTPAISLSKSANSNWVVLPTSPSIGANSFGINATGLAPGTYTSVITAAAPNYSSASLQVNLNVTQDPNGNNTISILPVADAYVRNGSYAAGNFGTETSLFAKTYTTKENYTRHAFLKFPLNSVTGISSAKLRIYGGNTETTTTINLSLFGVDNDSWTETGITWNNAPPSQTTELTSLAVNNVAKYFDLDVTSFIQEQIAGDKIASFVIKDPANQNQIAGFNSRENSANPPQLIIISSDPTEIPLKSLSFNSTTKNIEVEQGKVQSILEYLASSDNIPVNAQLNAVDASGTVPGWLTVNNKILNGISYTTGSEISFVIDATNLSIGEYTAKVTASATGYANAVLEITLTITSGSSGTLANIKVNFQDSATIPPTGWLKDFGQAFGPRNSVYQGSGYTYGWIKKSDNTPVDLTAYGRKRTSPSDILLATLMHMQGANATNAINGNWEVQVANGNYDVTVSVGDGSYLDSKHYINIEGVPTIINFIPTTSMRFKSATISVSVADGFLTIDANGGTNTKINTVTIVPTTTRRPSVVLLNPENNTQNVSENTSISTSILNLPNGGVNNATLTSASVYLTEELTGAIVPANVNGTGGGDAITLVPSSPLKLNTSYVFTITDAVKDLSGASFIPYSSTFKTTTVSTSEIVNAKFDKIALPNTVGRHSSLTIGPDGKLYALTIDGIIKRFVIKADGNLDTPELIYSLQDVSGTRTERLAIGLAFDPSSTATNLIAYVTHSSFVFYNAPNWDGKLTRLSGNNLQTVQDILVNLPRSAKDHLTNSIAFGPDGALYFTQGSLSAMGMADNTWGLRNESLLSAAVLRLDLSKVTSPPLNVLTQDGGGRYDPYLSGAPLTIYASGVRNAYDLLWHSNGKLYVPTNGSAAGGNTPQSTLGTKRPDGTFYDGASVPSLTNVQQTQKDFLFRVEKGGYYGHPNPTRGEYVLNGGNPTSSIDPAQVDAYPLGTLPDENWRGYAFDFQNNKSPNGVIEYKNNAFNGALKGKIMVVRYSQHDDIITLGIGGVNNDIVSSNEGTSIEGFSGFVDPLDLVEDVSKGNIYVSEYGGDGSITLLKPQAITPSGSIEVNPSIIYDNDVIGAPQGLNRTITIKNSGTSALTVSSISLSGANSSQYVLSGLPAFPKSINANDSISIFVAFNPSTLGIKTASVTILSNDKTNSTVSINLRGLGTAGLGGTNEPSLQSILNLYQLPIVVGDDDAATNVINSSTTLQKAEILGDEVSVQKFIKAGAGNVTIEPLSVFGPTSTNPILGMGWYQSGLTSSIKQLLSVSNSPVSNGQTVNVNFTGSTSFDPGTSSFGFYTNWPFFENRHLYSEDNLNTFTGSIPHHVRVYPYKDSTGTVPNTFIVAFEEHISGFDYQDFVFIVRNVKSAATNEYIVAPIADAYVRNGNYANKNYGNDTTLIVKTYNTSASYTRNSYFKFPLNQFTNITSAKLRIYGRNIDNASPINLSVFGVDNDAWTEGSITWNNAPQNNTTSLDIIGVDNLAKYYELDVTDFVKSQFSKDGVASLMVKDPSGLDKTLSFNSKEHANFPPQLVIVSSGTRPASNALLAIENLDKFPNNDIFVASRIHFPWSRDTVEPKIYNANHDTLRIRIRNKGISPLVIKNLIRSNTENWKYLKINGLSFDSATAFPLTINSGGLIDLTIQFISATDYAVKRKIFYDNLTIISNDDKDPSKILYFRGLWQRQGEGGNEPVAQEMISIFGFQTNTGFSFSDPDKGNPSKPKGDEILSSYFVRADDTKPVNIFQMGAYHGCCRQTETIRWHAKGSTTLTNIFTHIAIDAQSLLPRRAQPASPAQGTISPVGPFGLKIGQDWTDTLKNSGQLIGIRVWKAISAEGEVIPYSYIIANDYLGSSFTNYDYNDNMYFVSNIKPEIGTVSFSELVATPSAVDFAEKVLGTTNSFSLNLQNFGKVYANGSSDPSVAITKMVIEGENENEFALGSLAKNNLSPQENTSLTIKFNPISEGLKIADLLIYYNNSLSPLRVPLYGIGKKSTTSVIVHNRINSGSSTSLTINGKTWSADNQYAFDNLEPYTNPQLTKIKATDDDALYLVEQSSNGDKRPFRYEIPLPNGNYHVRLHFAEIYWGAPGAGNAGGIGSRVMSVNIENQLRLINFDVVQEVGSATAIVKNLPVTVTDGKLNINFSASVNRPMVCAVEVYSFNSGTTPMASEMVSSNLQIENIETLKVYPNPLSHSFNIDFPEEYKGYVTIKIADMIGRVYELGKPNIQGRSSMAFNISKLNLKPGIYFLQIHSAYIKTKIIKLVIK